MLKGQPPKFKASVWNLRTSETVVSVIQFSDLLIVIELLFWKEKRGRVQLGVYILTQFVFQGV